MSFKTFGVEISAFALFLIFLLGSAPLSGKAVSSSAGLGLTVNARGILLRNGAPYRGVGVNYYDAFLRNLRNPNDVSYRNGLAQLGAHGIPFARIAAGGYTAKDLQLYLTDKDAYFRQLDDVVQSAAKSNVGLIASAFWSIAAVSEAVHEPRARWGDAQSETRKFMRRYTQDLVSRYTDSPAIWGWEFSCELSLPFNLGPGQGRADRTLTYETFRSAALDFAQVVRKNDSHRILITGNSVPRANAFHNANGGRGPDTREQFARILLRDNPGPYNPLCIHASPGDVGQRFADRKVSYRELLQTCLAIGRSVGKAVYLEEFIPIPGRPEVGRGMSEKEYFASELAAVEASGIPIASVWVYDRKLVPDRSNLTFANERSYMLQMISDLNRRLQAQK